MFEYQKTVKTKRGVEPKKNGTMRFFFALWKLAVPVLKAQKNFFVKKCAPFPVLRPQKKIPQKMRSRPGVRIFFVFFSIRFSFLVRFTFVFFVNTSPKLFSWNLFSNLMKNFVQSYNESVRKVIFKKKTSICVSCQTLLYLK